MSIVRTSSQAKNWLNNHPGKALVRMVNNSNVTIVHQVGWNYKGVASLSTDERDNIATDTFFGSGEHFITEWMKDPDNTAVRFAGVEFDHTDGAWSDTEGPSLGNGFTRHYRAGGTAVGYILVYPS